MTHPPDSPADEGAAPFQAPKLLAATVATSQA
jgi:hypothetical protein